MMYHASLVVHQNAIMCLRALFDTELMTNTLDRKLRLSLGEHSEHVTDLSTILPESFDYTCVYSCSYFLLKLNSRNGVLLTRLISIML